MRWKLCIERQSGCDFGFHEHLERDRDSKPQHDAHWRQEQCGCGLDGDLRRKRSDRHHHQWRLRNAYSGTYGEWCGNDLYRAVRGSHRDVGDDYGCCDQQSVAEKQHNPDDYRCADLDRFHRRYSAEFVRRKYDDVTFCDGDE